MDASYVLVDAPRDTAATSLVLDPLLPYFPSLNNDEDEPWPWSHKRVADIRAIRASRSDGRLFIDEMLSSMADLDGTACYPPVSRSALVTLLVDLSKISKLQSSCLIYYLLLATHPDRAESYAAMKILPLAFNHGVIGFFALDSNEFRNGIAHLVSLSKVDYANRTLELLATQTNLRERSAFVLSYWRLGRVELKGEKELAIVLDALCDGERKFGVVEAWEMVRNWHTSEVDTGEGGDDDEEGEQRAMAELEDGEIRSRMCSRILSNCFGLNATSRPVPHHLLTLLAHPFSPLEDDISTALVLSPSSPLTSVPHLNSLAADWRISKYIAEGRALEAIRFGHHVQKKGVRGGEEDRERLLKSVRGSLSELQRARIELEIEPAGSTTMKSKSTSASTSSITQPSWEPMTATTTGSTSRLDVTAADLPLSASPFLRREKAHVSTKDGSSTGGLQKTLLNALKDAHVNHSSGSSTLLGSPRSGAMSGRASLVRLPTLSNDFGPSTTGIASPSRHGSPFSLGNNSMQRTGNESPRRLPTLAGFGSVRPPTAVTGLLFPSAPSVRGVQERLRSDSDSDDSDDIGVLARRAGRDQRMHREEEEEEEQEEEEPFGRRIVRDPGVARTLAAARITTPSRRRTVISPIAAAVPRSIPSKRRAAAVSVSSQSSRKNEKRRAISVEPLLLLQDGGEGLPGGFPGDMGYDREEKVMMSNSTTRSKALMSSSSKAVVRNTKVLSSRSKVSGAGGGASATPLRKSTRGSSVGPSITASAAKATPRKKTVVTKTGLIAESEDDVTRTQPRRSTRLGTPSGEMY